MPVYPYTCEDCGKTGITGLALGGNKVRVLEYLAAESIIFNPMPTDGRAVYTERPALPGTLVWHPLFADITDTGDLGYTTGPWTFSDSLGTPVAYGHYVSVRL